MEALILSCGTGGGHNSAALAIKEEMERRGHRVTMMNPYSLGGHGTDRLVNQAYVKLVQKAPKLFGFVYQLGNLYRRLPVKSPVYYANAAMAVRMEKYLKQHPCDVIIMPHLFPAELITYMKQKKMNVPKTIFVATDYTCIPFTEETNCDYYVVPAPDLVEEFASRGIPRHKIYPLGIPVSRKFYREEGVLQTSEAMILQRKRQENCKYILVAGGSIGAGNVEKIVETLLRRYDGDEIVHIVVICGNNKRLYHRMRRRFGEHIILVGYTKKMALYIRISSVFITKPGGLSSTEAAVAGIPILHVTEIPGCETTNRTYFEKHGMSISLTDPEQELVGCVQDILDGNKIEWMQKNQKKYCRKDAAKQICILAESGKH